MIPLFGDPAVGEGYWRLFKHAWGTLVFGTPAVIVFFVISGFCIHLPFRGSARIDVWRYYLRRYTRILIPVAAAIVAFRLMGSHLVFRGKDSILFNSPLWSLACEEIYYALYPLLRWIRNAVGWGRMLPGSFVVGVSIAATHPHVDGWQIFGPFGTAMILLPVWLLGCYLAEQAENWAKRIVTCPYGSGDFWPGSVVGARKWCTSSCTFTTRRRWCGLACSHIFGFAKKLHTAKLTRRTRFWSPPAPGVIPST
jgi:peptidoglycan/LPS O-acetylase OafA/YrhL